jgi:hypothetical protein
MTSRLLATRMAGVHAVTIAATPPRRMLYALLPDHGARPLDIEFLSELELAAASSTE